MLQSVELTPEIASKLVTSFFGPNTNKKLPVKRNQDLLRELTSKMDADAVSLYLTLMQTQL